MTATPQSLFPPTLVLLQVCTILSLDLDVWTQLTWVDPRISLGDWLVSLVSARLSPVVSYDKT